MSPIRKLIGLVLVTMMGQMAAPLWGEDVYAGPYQLPEAEEKTLTQRAKAGDRNAAYQLYTGLTMDKDRAAAVVADPWLVLAVKLKSPEAARDLAMQIGDNDHDYKAFGETRWQATENLLKESAKTYGLSCDDLGRAYMGGKYEDVSLGSKDFAQARQYYLQGSKFNIEFCWRPLAQLLHKGLGGPVDDRKAYYWVSIDALCVSPGSVSGDEIWALRNKIAVKLSLNIMQQEWVKIDAYISKQRNGAINVYPPPFNFGVDVIRSIKKGKEDTDRKEREHRQAMEKRG